MINSVFYATPQFPEVPTPRSRPAQSPVAPVHGDTVNFSAHALATAIMDAQLSEALDGSQA